MTIDTTHTDCIFCKVSSGDLPASVVHDDPDWLVVMDIHPIREGHVLIIPKRHVAGLSELTPSAQQTLFVLAEQVMRAQSSTGYAVGGGNLLLNDGVAANQHIPHLHLHCIPRRRGDMAAFGLRLLARTFGLFGRTRDRKALDANASALAPHVGSQTGRDATAATG